LCLCEAFEAYGFLYQSFFEIEIHQKHQINTREFSLDDLTVSRLS